MSFANNIHIRIRSSEKLFATLCIGARERESGQVTKIFSKIIIHSYNGDIPIVQWIV